MSLAYRAEIDGLRAIAVGAVVLYHAGLGGTGFVGVDVFFVISGYLITALLLREQESSGSNDLLAFYARRVRRILPATLVVVVATLVLSRLLMPLLPFLETAKSASASAVFGANFFFQLTTGDYFDAAPREMPLLHLWSLAVEEQFYIFWPALLLSVPRKRLRPVLAGVGALSFLLAEALMFSNPEAAFYQMPARLWELAAGGIIAALPPRAMPKWLRAAGIAVTLAACAVSPDHFPGAGALPAVLGACMVVAAVHGGARNRFLASAPMVGIGLLSYSLYLWHWPLLALYRATSIGEGQPGVRVLLCVVALLLAMVTYRYVEQPIRRLRGHSGLTVALGAAASLLVAGLAWTWSVRAIGSDEPLALLAEADRPADWLKCHYQATDAGPLRTGCGEPARIVLWGDSMAMAWRPLLAAYGPGIDYSRDACPPYVDWLPGSPRPADRRCRDWNALVVREAAKADTVILVARWASLPPEAIAGLRETLRQLPKVRRVIVIGPTPELRGPVPRCIRQHALAACAIPRAEFEAQAAPVRRALHAAAPGVEWLEPAEWLCNAAYCPALREGVPLYWDEHHVSASAAAAYARSLSAKARR